MGLIGDWCPSALLSSTLLNDAALGLQLAIPGSAPGSHEATLSHVVAWASNATYLHPIPLLALSGLAWAWVWFATLLLAVFVYVLAILRRSDYSLWENCLYAPTFLMGRLWWRVAFTNSPPQELQSGAILVANHRSSVDPFFVQLAAGRRVHWMVAKEFCNHFLFGAILRPLQVIPTNRSGMDTASTKTAIRFTREGRLVGMFPEGRINTTGEPLLPVRGGAAVVATKSKVPMIPLFIKGSPYRRTVWSPVLMPAQVTITFGSPIYPKQDATESQDSGELDDTGPADTDSMILNWANQIVALAGHASWEVQLASARRRRKRPESKG